MNEPGLYGVLHESTRTATLLVPRHGVEYEIWCGKLPSQSMYKERYGVDKVMFVDELSAYLSDLGVKKIQVLQGVNSDSGTAISPMAFDGIERFEVDGSVLLEILTEARLIKTAKELAVMQYVNDISSKAHVHVMQNCRPGLHEFQLEAMFVHFTEFYGGCRYQSYTCICGSGPNGAVLHYGHAGAPNDAPVKDGGMCLLDMGAEWHCYASDITCSFPANGRRYRAPAALPKVADLGILQESLVLNSASSTKSYWRLSEQLSLWPVLASNGPTCIRWRCESSELVCFGIDSLSMQRLTRPWPFIFPICSCLMASAISWVWTRTTLEGIHAGALA